MKDVVSINAEIKIVKCLIDSIQVDISANQVGGLLTLHMLDRCERGFSETAGGTTRE